MDILQPLSNEVFSHMLIVEKTSIISYVKEYSVTLVSSAMFLEISGCFQLALRSYTYLLGNGSSSPHRQIVVNQTKYATEAEQRFQLKHETRL